MRRYKLEKKLCKALRYFLFYCQSLRLVRLNLINTELNADAECLVGEKIYQCKVVQRERPQENRITTYFLSPELGYLIVKIEDQDKNGDTLLELKSLL